MISIHEATVSSQGQVTIPAELRRELGLEKGRKVQFILEDDGSVTLRVPTWTLENVIGSVQPIPGTSEDFDEEIEQAWMDEVDRKYRVPART